MTKKILFLPFFLFFFKTNCIMFSGKFLAQKGIVSFDICNKKLTYILRNGSVFHGDKTKLFDHVVKNKDGNSISWYKLSVSRDRITIADRLNDIAVYSGNQKVIIANTGISETYCVNDRMIYYAGFIPTGVGLFVCDISTLKRREIISELNKVTKNKNSVYRSLIKNGKYLYFISLNQNGLFRVDVEQKVIAKVLDIDERIKSQKIQLMDINEHGKIALILADSTDHYIYILNDKLKVIKKIRASVLAEKPAPFITCIRYRQNKVFISDIDRGIYKYSEN